MALAIALHVWGAPACGQVGVAWMPDQWNVAGRGDAVNCVLELNATYGYPRSYRQNWPLLCTVVVHEWGHITGHQHSPDPRNVMYANPDHPYWRCDTNRPNYGFPVTVKLGPGT